MNPTRRALLLGTFAAQATLLAGCGTTGPLTPASVITDAQTIISGLDATLTQIQAADPGLIAPAALAKAQGYVAQAKAALATLSANLPAAQGATTLATIEGYINGALNTLAAFPLIPQPYAGYIQAAAVLLPIIEAFSNVTLGTASATASARAAPIAMTADHARLLLRRASGG